MPIHEYRCSQCGEEFEKLVFSESEAVICPECKGAKVSKLMSVCAFSVGSNSKGTADSTCGTCTPSASSCASCGVKH